MKTENYPCIEPQHALQAIANGYPLLLASHFYVLNAKGVFRLMRAESLEIQYQNSPKIFTEEKSNNIVPAPTYQDITDWFIDQHGVLPIFWLDPGYHKWRSQAYYIQTAKKRGEVYNGNLLFDTHYQAMENSITEAFQLILNEKSKVLADRPV